MNFKKRDMDQILKLNMKTDFNILPAAMNTQF